LQRLYLGREISYRKFSPRVAPVLAAIGMLIYGTAGIVPMLYGASFLDYGSLPLFWVHGAELRALGILIVEIGIGLAVFGTLVLIFDNLAGERW
jgi:multicomponent Na+:H+ antiporter subunit B